MLQEERPEPSDWLPPGASNPKEKKAPKNGVLLTLAVIVPVLIAILALIAIMPLQFKLYILLAFLALLVAALFRPMHKIFLGYRVITAAVALFIAAGASSIFDEQNLSVEQQRIDAFVSLKSQAPHDYQQQLYGLVLGLMNDEQRALNLSVLKTSAPETYGEIINALEDRVAKVPASDTAKNIHLYNLLSKLEPQNSRYAAKVEHYEDKAREIKTMRTNPENYIKITGFSWKKAGFDNVMEVTLTINNSLPYRIKDIVLKCTHTAPSGTEIDSNTRTIYEMIMPGKSKTLRDFNMGFMHYQVERSSCVAINATVME